MFSIFEYEYIADVSYPQPQSITNIHLYVFLLAEYLWYNEFTKKKETIKMNTYDYAGSFLRPERLKKARRDFENNTINLE